MSTMRILSSVLGEKNLWDSGFLEVDFWGCGEEIKN
jgi:hypothetical protein